MPELSRRAARLLDAPPMPAYIAEHFARLGDAWDPGERPDGYVGLCVAENKRCNEALLALLGRHEAPPAALGYDAMTGNGLFRERLAGFLARSFLGRRFDASQLAVLAGAGSVLELLFHVLADPGDTVIVPTPSYAGFWPDLQARDGLAIVTAERSATDGFALTPAILDAAAERADSPVRALLYTNPDNPLGRVAPAEEVRAVLEWGRQRGVHVVVDEIYALSVFGDRTFKSAASVAPSLGEGVHLVWAFSKDFGASGLRCGVLVSENEAVMNAVGGLAYWAACSGHTQHLLSALVADDAAVDEYLAGSRRALAEAYAELTGALERMGVPYVAADAGFFLLADLRGWLPAPTWEAERALWRRLLDAANVNLTPGEDCRVGEPGFFRVCYAAAPRAAVAEGLRRLGEVLRGS